MKPSRGVLFSIIIVVAIVYLWTWFKSSYLSSHESDFKNYVVNIGDRSRHNFSWDEVMSSVTEVNISTSHSHTEQNKSNSICFDCIVLVIVSCGDRFDETKNLIKSAIALSAKSLIIKVFTEELLLSQFTALPSLWPKDVQRRVSLNIQIANFPHGFKDKTWRNLFKKCASVRLFLPELLPDVDSVIYTDTDVLFLGPIEKVWGHFYKMNSTQMVAMVQEHEDPATGWYNRFAKHPFYGKLGLNSGVMLMNLTRLRKFGWVQYLSPVLGEFQSAITWGDQDIINIIFHYHPDKLYLIGCEYNYRPDHCMYMSVCKSAERNGVFALHGSRGVFYNEKQPSFKTVYNTYSEFELGEDLRQRLYYPLQRRLLSAADSNCGKISKIFLDNLGSMVNL